MIKKYDLPVPIYDLSSNVDGVLLLYLASISNYNKGEEYRYIPLENIDYNELEAVLGKTRKTINRKLSLLVKTGILTPKNTKYGGVYIFNYKKNNKHYITLNEDVFQVLINNLTDMDIKVFLYIYSTITLIKNNNISNEQICENLGYSKNSRNNLNKIKKSIDNICNLNILSKRVRTIYNFSDNNNMKTYKKIITYQLKH